MDSTVLCTSCSWFGVYRTDVTERMTGCPSCGSLNLAVRDVGEDEWRDLGRRLLEGEEVGISARHSASAGRGSPTPRPGTRA
jgi:hypothetical protein